MVIYTHMVGFWPVFANICLFSSLRLIVIRDGIKAVKYRVTYNVPYIQGPLQLAFAAGTIHQTHFLIHSNFIK